MRDSVQSVAALNHTAIRAGPIPLYTSLVFLTLLDHGGRADLVGVPDAGLAHAHDRISHDVPPALDEAVLVSLQPIRTPVVIPAAPVIGQTLEFTWQVSLGGLNKRDRKKLYKS